MFLSFRSDLCFFVFGVTCVSLFFSERFVSLSFRSGLCFFAFSERFASLFFGVASVSIFRSGLIVSFMLA